MGIELNPLYKECDSNIEILEEVYTRRAAASASDSVANLPETAKPLAEGKGPKPVIENAQVRALAAQQVTPKPPLSPVRVLPNGTVMMSGMLPFTAPGILKQGTMEELVAQIFVNIKAELAKLDLTLNDVVDVTILMTDLKNDYDLMNAAYAKEFADVKIMPTRMAYGVDQLPFGASIEIKCTAYKAP